MLSFKRFVIVGLVTVLALTGVITANAYTGTQDQVIRQQDAPAAWLGVSIADTDGGVMVTQVMPGSPADDAGLRHGDLITAVGETEIDSMEVLVETIQGHAPGDEIELTFTRGDEAQTVTVTLAERPDEVVAQPYLPGEAMFGVLDMFGLTLEISDEGLTVESIAEGSPFADSGLEVGDLITAIDGESVTGEFMPGAMFGHMGSDGPVIFTVVRDGETMEIEVTLDMASMMPEVFRPDSDLQIQPVPATRPTQLGVQFQTIDAGVVEEKGLTVEQGALIVEVFEDTPAAGAGLLVDDIILAVDGDVVDEERTLADRLYAYEEGDVVTLTVLRGEEEIGIEVELGPRNVGFGMTTGSIQVMPMQPGQQGFFGYGFGPGMGHHMRPGMEFFFQGQPGGFFEMHPFMDGGFFEFHFGNDHPFWGSKDEAGSAGSGGESGSSADNSDSGESMQQVAPDTSNDTPL